MIATLSALIVAASEPTAADQGWAQVSAWHALSKLTIEMSIGTLEGDPGPEGYWVRRTLSGPNRQTATITTDTRRCAGILPVLKALDTLPTPHIITPLRETVDTGGVTNLTVIADGVGYSLSVPADYGRRAGDGLTITSNVGTPRADWVERLQAAVRSCVPEKP